MSTLRLCAADGAPVACRPSAGRAEPKGKALFQHADETGATTSGRDLHATEVSAGRVEFDLSYSGRVTLSTGVVAFPVVRYIVTVALLLLAL